MAQAEWIWYPDDFEIELSNRFMAERYERDVMIPPFWKNATEREIQKNIRSFAGRICKNNDGRRF